MRQFEYPQPSLFDENKSRVELPPAQKLELATLVKLLLLENRDSAGKRGDRQ